MPASQSPFAASYLKTKRAKRHIQELQDMVGPYLADNPIDWKVFETWRNPDGSPGLRWDSEARPLPCDVPAVMGDIIHNIRSALDIMATSLAEANGKRGDNVYFPFSADEADIDDMIRRKNFTSCGPEAIVLLKSFSPWKGGNKLLRAVHDLDIIDKHKALMPTPFAAAQIVIPIVGKDPDGNVELGTPHVANEPPPLTFPEESGLAGLRLFETLEEMVDLCEGILESFVPIHELNESRRKEGENPIG